MRELRWIAMGAREALVGAVVTAIVLGALKAFSELLGLDPSIVRAAKLLFDLLALSYVVYVATKRTWVKKELYFSVGLVLASVVISPQDAAVGLLALAVVLARLLS